jgi:2-amino-4-hydroxy-6-hydroxymethyldihydropteridine diphosphokinase
VHIVFIALGSNLGDRHENLQVAIESMQPEIHPLDCSSVYETPPWGYLDQPKFLNQVIKAETQLSPSDLLDYLQVIESQIGRKETIRYGPRVIDLDLLFYDDEVIESPLLTIPHPRMENRAFVLLPIADLAPEFIHPVLKVRIADLLARVDQEGIDIYASESCADQGE